MRFSGLILVVCLPVFTHAQLPDIISFEKQVIGPEAAASCARIDVLSAAPTDNYDLKYQWCNWVIDPDTLYITGTITSQLLLTSNSAHIYFDLSDTLTVDVVTVDGSPVAFVQENNALVIELDMELPAGSTIQTAVTYHGTPYSSGFGSFKKTSHNSGNVIWTLSEPYGASDWWPCKQTLNDKMDSVDVWITIPESCKAGGPGSLIAVDPAAIGWHTYKWKHNYPVATYLIGIAVTNFVEFSFKAAHPGDSVLFFNLVYPQSLEEATTQINDIVPAFEIFSNIYGDYPYADEKYGHMQFGWGGGMEHQTMSSVSGFSHELLVHEMAHQWFGDKITCANWHDIWLNEGFATYSTWLSYNLGDDPNNYYEAWLRTSRDKIVALPDGSVYVDDTTLVSRIFDGRLTYYKGAWLLHMLRWELGDEAFFSGVKNYISDPELAFSYAHTNDFIGHMEAIADTSLAAYLADWFYGEGYPSFQVLWQQDSLGHMIISLSQNSSDASVSFFDMHVPLRLYGDGDSIDLRLKHSKNGELFTFDAPFMVDEIALDPDLRILHANDAIVKLPMEDGILQVALYPNPAANELHIQMLEPSPANYTITIWNGAAEQVLHTTFTADGDAASYMIDTSAWPPGLYMVLINSGDREVVRSVVVQ